MFLNNSLNLGGYIGIAYTHKKAVEQSFDSFKIILLQKTKKRAMLLQQPLLLQQLLLEQELG